MHLLDTTFIDNRGIIVNILAADSDKSEIGGVQLIRTVAGVVRANHWHRRDWHALYIISGRVRYYARDVGSNCPPTVKDYYPGDTIVTGPRVEHALEFLENTLMVSVSGLKRGEQEHDVVALDVDLTEEIGEIQFVAEGELVG